MDQTIVVSIIAMVVWAISGIERQAVISTEPVEIFASDISNNETALGDASPIYGASVLNEYCVEDMVSQVPVSVVGDRLVVSSSLDLTTCLSLPYKVNRSPHNAYAHGVQVYFEVSCPGSDLSDFHGLTVKDLDAMDPPCDQSDGATVTHRIMSDVVVRRLDSHDHEDTGLLVSSTHQSPEGQSCTIVTKDSYLYLENCQEVEQDYGYQRKPVDDSYLYP